MWDFTPSLRLTKLEHDVLVEPLVVRGNDLAHSGIETLVRHVRIGLLSRDGEGIPE